MDTIIKLNSNQGGPFTATSNLVDFDIPAVGSYDLSDSFVTINARIDTTEADDVIGIHNIPVKFNGSDNSFFNVALVKNCSLRAGNVGMLEDIHRVDVLRQNLNEYTLSTAQKDSLEYRSFRQVFNTVGKAKYTIFRELIGEGKAPSKELTARVQIPLSQLFELGKLQAYPAQRMGPTRIHLELNVDKISVDAANEDVFTTYSAMKGIDDIVNATTGALKIGSSDLPLVTKTKFANLENSPWYNGMKVKVAYTQSGGKDFTTTIEEINHIEGGAVKIFLTQLATPGNQSLPAAKTAADVTITPVLAASAKITFDTAELTLRRLAKPPRVPKVINYNTFTTELFTATGSPQSFQRMFQLEPSSVNVFLMFVADNSTILSDGKDLRSIRLRLDNEELTNREIIISPKFSPLHYDRLSMALLNGGMPLKSALQRNFQTNVHRISSQTATKAFISGQPVPISPLDKQLQVNLEYSSTGLKQLNLYKQVFRSIKV